MSAGAPRPKVAVTGSSGLIGSALRARLVQSSYQVRRVVRRPPGADEVEWQPGAGRIEAAGLEGVRAVVHLAGENLAGGRWTATRRQRLWDSRIQSTQLLASTLATLSSPPEVLVCASAIGYYGDRDDEVLTEDSPKGTGFLSDLVAAWEAAADRARQAGVRVVHLRQGIVLSPAGGPLRLMLPPFRLGLGGPLGSGRQWMSWISLDDAVEVALRAIAEPVWRGSLNVVAPAPVRNWEFTEVLASALRRPALFRVPAVALQLVLGDMARETVLASTRVAPTELTRLGYEFHDREIGPTLRRLVA